MDPARQTLVEIAFISRGVANTLVRYAGDKTLESFQLEKIGVASGAIMETLNKTLLVESGTVDDRLKDWLESDEPRKCLDILNQMKASFSPKLDRGVKSFFQSSHSASTKDRSIEAIRLFWKHEGYFHFLLSTDIWNRETGLQQQSLGVPPPSVLRAHGAIAKQDLAQVAPSKVGGPSTVTQHRKSKTSQRVDAKNLNNILKWLSAWSCKEILERTLLLRQADTCTWLPDTKAYKTWKNTESSFLWLHGKPGAGKSVLAASVIDGLESSLPDGGVLAYFYCDFRNERSTNAAEVMRSLLSQLLQSFRRHAVDPGDLFDKLIEERDGGASTISNAIHLARYISRAAKQLSRQPFLVIDALDECADVESLLDALVELQRGGIRLFVTSRPLQIIKEYFSGLPSIDMDMMNYEMSEDIKLHVTRELDSHRRLRILDASLKNEIHTVLCERADGMFRWVQCQLGSLKRCVTAVHIRKVLNDLPTTLNETYERILLKTSEDEHEGILARRALDWLVVALVPLQLSQIIEGLSIDPASRVLNRDSGPVHGPALLDVLGSLVIHNEMTDIVILSHFSVKEYLIAESTRTKHPAYHVDEQAAHLQVALLCMGYIGAYLEHQQSGYDEGSPQNARRVGIRLDGSDMASRSIKYHRSPLPTSDFHSLDEYVLSCGFDHLSHVDPGNRTVFRAIKTLHSNAEQHPSEWDHLCRRSSCFPRWPTLEHDFMLYILVAFAPPPLLHSFIGNSRPKLKDGTNPLIYAACFRKIEHARILLSKGVSLNHRGCHVTTTSHWILPLESAVMCADRSPHMVDLFLTEGSPVPHKLFVEVLLERYCYMSPCVVSRLLQTDEFVEWSANAWDEELLLRALDLQRYRYPWRQPSQQHIDIIQQRFVQIGCNPSTRFNETSLRHAISAGHVSTVQNMLSQNIPLPLDTILDASWSATPNTAMIHLCLKMGSDVQSVSCTEDTPLHIALACHYVSESESDSEPEDECSEKVQVLIDAGCNPSACNLAGETPLHLAVSQGYISIAKDLLLLHVPLPPDILLAASKSQNASIIHLLAGKGADVDAIAANGDSPLHRALGVQAVDNSEEPLKCVKALITVGCNPCLPNANGKTPFNVAAENGHLSVVQYLHSTLSPLLPPDILLSIASTGSESESGIIPVINFLINKGASIHVTCSSGNTLLHLAIMANIQETECLKRIKALVNAGCDPHVFNLANDTPFHLAARKGYVLVMEHLLSLGISVPSDVMLTQFEGDGPCHGHSTICFLLEKGGDICTIAQNGDTLLHLAAAVYQEEEALKLVKQLVHTGCIPCALNSLQETPLHIAARHGFTSVIKYILSLNIALPPDVLLAASTGRFEKHDAAQMIRFLVQEGASVSVATTDGDTALHLLLTAREELEDDRLECVKILIDAGCDPRAQNSAGKAPVHAAASSGFSKILEYLLSQGVPLPDDIFLISTTKTIRFLLGKGLDLHGVAANGRTELMHRVLGLPRNNNPIELARILVGVGWDPSLKNSAGETAIHVAARNCQIDVIKFLLSQNAPLPSDVLLAAAHFNLKYYWDTGCHPASLTRFLIREGASVNVAASNGDTPLHLAMTRNPDEADLGFTDLPWWELIEILLNHGSDPSARNVDGQTAFDLAEARGHFFKENFLRLVRNSNAHGLRS